MLTTEITVELEGYHEVWKSGQRLLNAVVSLGQNEKSSSATVTLADPDGSIAADVINHTLENGGILALPSSGASSGQPGSIHLDGSSGAGAVTSDSPRRKAFLDTIAYSEGVDFPAKNGNSGYNTLVGYGTFQGYTKHPAIYVPTANSDAAGRYQFLSSTYNSDAAKLGLTDFSPASQDKAALYEVQQKGALGDVDSGNTQSAILKCNTVWASFPGSPYGQPTKTMPELLAFYNQRLAYYQGGGTQAQPVDKVDPTANTEPSSLFKGRKLTVTVGEYVFEYYHQGTYTADNGVTTLVGQGLRWVLNRRKRSKTAKGISLKQLAQSIAEAHKISLKWLADFEPVYVHVDQRGLTDYQLLLRECDRNGLAVSESQGSLTVKSLRNLNDTKLVLAPGVNMLSYEIKDTAIDTSKADESSSLLQDDAKADIDPLSGKIAQLNADIDPVKDTSTTGRKSSVVAGSLQPGHDAIAKANRGRWKRVKGLPSTFTVYLSDETIQLQPLDVLRTTGFKTPLNRVWLVDNVQHDLAAGTTKLNCYSPIEVLDLTPPGSTTAITTPNTQLKPDGFIYPVRGYVITSPFGPRNSPTAGASSFHKGTDYGCPSGTPIVASADGIVEFAEYQDGYGNVIYLKHPSGWETRYAHLSVMQVRPGQQVKQGQQIALSGATGIGTGPHLHHEFRDPSGTAHKPEDVGLKGTAGYTP